MILETLEIQVSSLLESWTYWEWKSPLFRESWTYWKSQFFYVLGILEIFPPASEKKVQSFSLPCKLCHEWGQCRLSFDYI